MGKSGHMQTFSSCTVSFPKRDFFDVLTPDQKKLLDDNTVDITYKKGEIICKHGTFAPHIIFLKKGLVKVYLEGAHDNLILKLAVPGSLIGLSSLSDDDSAFHYTASTYLDSEASLINIDFFRQIIRENGEFACSVVAVFCNNALQTYGRFFSFTHKQLYGRLADILLCLSERIFYKEEFKLNLSRKELGELTGMATESVIRMLKRFKQDGLIDMDGKIIKIKDYELLLKISDYG
ncbi:MAG: Crp/Fnr family transcriptional regulator [Bacteroidales bacterium]|nr:Crp/Fnr family transcriptional regulator [Bacteroidales bacterium]